MHHKYIIIKDWQCHKCNGKRCWHICVQRTTSQFAKHHYQFAAFTLSQYHISQCCLAQSTVCLFAKCVDYLTMSICSVSICACIPSQSTVNFSWTPFASNVHEDCSYIKNWLFLGSGLEHRQAALYGCIKPGSAQHMGKESLWSWLPYIYLSPPAHV